VLRGNSCAEPVVTLERFSVSRKAQVGNTAPRATGTCRPRVDGKLVLTLGDSIRLALSNKHGHSPDHSQIEFAQDNLLRCTAIRSSGDFPSFADNRAKSPRSHRFKRPVWNPNPDNDVRLFAQLFQTDKFFRLPFRRTSCYERSLSLLNPSLASNLQFTVTRRC